MIALNLGTRGIDAARNLVEYCNHPGGIVLERPAQVPWRAEPHGFKVWCLGNEMDGPWQIGYKTADEYGRLACEAGKAMKLFDPSLRARRLRQLEHADADLSPWEATVLDHCYEHGRLTSRCTATSRTRRTTCPLPRRVPRDGPVYPHHRRHLRFRPGEKTQQEELNLSFDEWNVWFHSNAADVIEPVAVGPPLLEDVYTIEDALVVGCCLITLLRHADRVRLPVLPSWSTPSPRS